MWKEFKEFAMKGNVMDMAVGIIIGAAFGTIVNSLVGDLVTPIIGLLWKADFTNIFAVLKEGTPPGPYATLDAAKEAGAVTMNWGVFLNTVLNFIILAFVIFLMVRQMNKLRKQPPPPDPTTKDCPYCMMTVPIKATRCGHCTSELKTA